MRASDQRKTARRGNLAGPFLFCGYGRDPAFPVRNCDFRHRRGRAIGVDTLSRQGAFFPSRSASPPRRFPGGAFHFPGRVVGTQPLRRLRAKHVPDGPVEFAGSGRERQPWDHAHDVGTPCAGENNSVAHRLGFRGNTSRTAGQLLNPAPFQRREFAKNAAVKEVPSWTSWRLRALHRFRLPFL